MNSLVFHTKLDSPFSGWLPRKAAAGFMGRLTNQCFSTLRCKDARVQKICGKFTAKLFVRCELGNYFYEEGNIQGLQVTRILHGEWKK